jgi:hypothetical protein
VDPSSYSLALDEARRAVDRQAEDVASFRTRTTGLVSVGALAAAFIGGLALREDAPLTVWTILGAALFAALLVVAVFALWPRSFKFTTDARVLVDWIDGDEGQSADLAEMDRDLALHLAEHYDANAGTIDWLRRFYVAGLVILIFEIAFLLLDLRGS